MKPSISRIVINFGSSKPAKRYPIGATRLKGKTVYIKQFRMAYDGQGRPIGTQARRGKSLTEWVVKGGPRDIETKRGKQ